MHKGMKEMLDEVNGATHVMAACILYAADRIGHGERKVQHTTSAVHSREDKCTAPDGGLLQNLLLPAIS